MITIKHFGENEDTGHLELMYTQDSVDIYIDAEIVTDSVDYTEENYQYLSGRPIHPKHVTEVDTTPYFVISVQAQGYGEICKFTEIRDVPDQPIKVEFFVELVNDYFKRMAERVGTIH